MVSRKSSIKTGDRFSMLTAIEKVPRSPGSREMWLFQCDCGNTVIRNVSKLVYNHSRRPDTLSSCGCSKSESIKISNQRKSLPFGTSARNSVIATYKWNAKKRNLDFDLTTDQCETLFKGRCYYCNAEPSRVFIRPHTHGEYIYNGIDRLDNSIGYVIGNVVSCCTKCNYLKSDMSYSEFICMINLIAANHPNEKVALTEVNKP